MDTSASATNVQIRAALMVRGGVATCDLVSQSSSASPGAPQSWVSISLRPSVVARRGRELPLDKSLLKKFQTLGLDGSVLSLLTPCQETGCEYGQYRGAKI